MTTKEMPKYTTQTYCYSNASESPLFPLMQVNFLVPVLYQIYVKQCQTSKISIINSSAKRGKPGNNIHTIIQLLLTKYATIPRISLLVTVLWRPTTHEQTKK